ncbi:hypothetical protein CR513_45560, partial [Mucuna pruriens]
MATWEDLDLSSSKDEDEKAYLCWMADTTSEDEDDQDVKFNNLVYLQIAYQELLSNSSTFSLRYKELKIKFSKLSKDFESLEKENSILKKENEKLKEEQTNDLSKVNTYEITELQKEVIDLRQSLAKFLNGREPLSWYLDSRCSHHMIGKELKHNLLSINQLCDNGYDVPFNKGECIVRVIMIL